MKPSPIRSPVRFRADLRIENNGLVTLYISGTASIDEQGRSVHIGDFRAQLRRTFDNITGLLEAEGATWKDIVRTTCYLRDIERDYESSTKSARRSITSRALILCPPPPASRPSCAVRNC